MTSNPLILIVDSNAADAALARAVLEHGLPLAEVRLVDDALTFAEAINDGRTTLAIVAADLAWSRLDKLLAVLARRAPATAVLVFARAEELATLAAGGLAVDGVALKGSTGFVTLPALVEQVLARRGVPLATGATVAPGGSARVPAAAARSERNIGEMRDLALVFSHDLKEPLQQIMRLARRAQAGEEGGPRAHASLQQMLECAARASTMLDATLEYLSVTARDDTPSLVDLNVSLERALENLRGAIDEAGAEIVSEHLPTVSGDEVQLLHLFQNLIANALKFRGRERPLLRITVTQQDQDWLLAFRDNGIGIAQVHAERIFEMGQRLHTRDEFPGSGIGLALCKRIVERLGGRIWVESADGAGATFYILLPRAAGQSAKQT